MLREQTEGSVFVVVQGDPRGEVKKPPHLYQHLNKGGLINFCLDLTYSYSALRNSKSQKKKKTSH